MKLAKMKIHNKKMDGEMATFSNEGNIELEKVSDSRKELLYWCFTMFYKDGDLATLEAALEGLRAKYVIGRETCPTTGRPHLQGFVIFRSKFRALSSKVLKPFKCAWFTCKAGLLANYNYCTKEKNFVTNFDINLELQRQEKRGTKRPREDDPEEVLINYMAGKTLYKYQQDILELIEHNRPDGRKIHLFYEKVGNVGKSDFIKWLKDTAQPGHVLEVPTTETKRAIYAIADSIKRTGRKPRVVFLDIERDEIPNWSMLVHISNGKGCQEMHTPDGSATWNKPHVIIMANFVPYAKMSADRLVIHEITELTHYEHSYKVPEQTIPKWTGLGILNK